MEDGRFLQVGSDADLLASASENASAVDLQGRFVCAGFNDSHMHLLNYGQSLHDAQLAGHINSLADVLACLKAFLHRHHMRQGQWLTGRGWNQDYFTDVSRMPDRRDLDSISSTIPIMITRSCGHCCVVNSRVLQLAGIGPDTQSPDGGSIGMENGEPDGRLYDNAIELLNDVLPLPSVDELKEMIGLACAELNRYGVTSAQTDDYFLFRSLPFEAVNDAYRELEAEGKLSVRIYEQANFTTLEELKRFVESGNVTGTGSDLFRIGPLKIVGDGALDSRTAHLSRPYADDEQNRGFSLLSDGQMSAMVSYAHAQGMQIAIHAIGDACLDQVLNAFAHALQEQPVTITATALCTVRSHVPISCVEFMI